MKNWILALAFTILMTSTALADSLTAKVNRNPVPAGETFVLSLDYVGEPGTEKPDFSVLNHNFTVYSVLNSYKSYYSNGNFTKTYQWNVTLAANNTGTITIPAISVGNYKSKPITLKVVDAASLPGDVAPAQLKFSVSRSISNPNPLVQQQINYTFKITTSEALQGSVPQFMSTNGDDWIIRSLGNPEIVNRLQNGVEIKEITFNYALFPQKSGDLVIPEVRFEGFYINPENRNSNSMQQMLGAFGGLDDDAFGLGMLGARVPVNLAARSISISVGKIPAENNGYWWLPAKQAELYSNWQKKIPEFKSGEAVNREIYLRVNGVIDTQLPKIEFPNIEGVKQYPEKPTIQSDVKGEDVVSIMKINTVYIPERSGKVMIPEIAVNWYNIKTKKMEKATLPSITVDVVRGTAVEQVSDTSNILRTERGEEIDEVAKDSIDLLAKSAPSPIIWYVLAAFIAGIGVSYLLFRPRKEKVAENTKVAPISVAKAIRNNDVKSVRDNVIAWGRKQYPDANICNLDDVDALVKNAAFSQQLQKLGRALYSGCDDDFNSAEFMGVFANINKNNKKNNSGKSLLPELYK